MLQKFEITGVHYRIDDSLRKHVISKLGQLDRYIPRHSRSSAHMEIRLREAKTNGKMESVCDATLYLPHETISIAESAANMYAAVDIIKTTLKQQIKKYKDEYTSGKQFRHMFSRLRRSLP